MEFGALHFSISFFWNSLKAFFPTHVCNFSSVFLMVNVHVCFPVVEFCAEVPVEGRHEIHDKRKPFRLHPLGAKCLLDHV